MPSPEGRRQEKANGRNVPENNGDDICEEKLGAPLREPLTGIDKELKFTLGSAWRDCLTGATMMVVGQTPYEIKMAPIGKRSSIFLIRSDIRYAYLSHQLYRLEECFRPFVLLSEVREIAPDFAIS